MSGVRGIARVLRLGGVYRRLGAGVSLLELCKDGAVEAVLKRCLAAVLGEVYDYFAVAARFPVSRDVTLMVTVLVSPALPVTV